jgi:hypothetical protein
VKYVLDAQEFTPETSGCWTRDLAASNRWARFFRFKETVWIRSEGAWPHRGGTHATEPGERYGQLYAAQQALKWTTERRGFAAPLDVIESGAVQPPMLDTQEVGEGCLVAAHPAQS